VLHSPKKGAFERLSGEDWNDFVESTKVLAERLGGMMDVALRSAHLKGFAKTPLEKGVYFATDPKSVEHTSNAPLNHLIVPNMFMVLKGEIHKIASDNSYFRLFREDQNGNLCPITIKATELNHENGFPKWSVVDEDDRIVCVSGFIPLRIVLDFADDFSN
jgi:hypothetical protein